jgi:hypothetical protein
VFLYLGAFSSYYSWHVSHSAKSRENGRAEGGVEMEVWSFHSEPSRNAMLRLTVHAGRVGQRRAAAHRALGPVAAVRGITSETSKLPSRRRSYGLRGCAGCRPAGAEGGLHRAGRLRFGHFLSLHQITVGRQPLPRAGIRHTPILQPAQSTPQHSKALSGGLQDGHELPQGARVHAGAAATPHQVAAHCSAAE